VSTRAPLWLGLVVAALVLPVYALTLAPGLTWANQSADGGDLITAAATGGVAHPSGYPTYLLLARLVQHLPLEPLAARTTWLSAVAAALAAGLVVPLVSRTTAGPRAWGLVGGGVAGLGLGLSPLLWSQAVVTEVHALHTLFCAALLYTLPLPDAPPPSHRAHGLAGLIAGLALGNHLTVALLLPAWLALSVGGAGRAWRPALGWRLAGVALGLLVYLYLPLAAAGRPPVNWGGAATPAGWWWVVSGAPYQALAFGLASALALGRVAGWAALLVAQFSWLGLLVGVVGLFFGPVRGWGARAVTLWIVGVYSAFALGYNAADSYAYLLPVFLALALSLGWGVAALLNTLAARPRRAVTVPALVGVLLVALGLNAARHWPAVDASRDRRAEDFGRAVLAAAPAQAVIVTQGDQDTFALWYFHFALRQRPDLAVVVEPLLAFDWYRATLRATYPDLPELSSGTDWRVTLEAAGRRLCDPRVDTAPALVCP